MLEFSFGLFLAVRVFIRVPLHGKLSIGFLEIIVFGASVNLKNLVVVDAHAFCLVLSLRVLAGVGIYSSV